MVRALVIFHSRYGNTKRIAEILTQGITDCGIETDCLHIDEVDLNKISNYDFLAIGCPTHMIGMSKEMKEFLQRFKDLDLKGMMGFCFDTRNDSRMNKSTWLILENSAARRIEGILRKMKMKIIKSRASAIVLGREGPLEEESESQFIDIGKEIGLYLMSK